MAKALVWVGMLVVMFGSIIFGMKVINSDKGQIVGYAISAPDGSNICDLQVIVTTMMNFTDGPTQTISPQSTTPDWPHWATTHFIVIDDATQQQLPFRKGGFKSKDITENQFGASEVILHADLEAGKDYTFHFVPISGQPEKYVMKIKGEATEFRRRTFAPDY